MCCHHRHFSMNQLFDNDYLNHLNTRTIFLNNLFDDESDIEVSIEGDRVISDMSDFDDESESNVILPEIGPFFITDTDNEIEMNNSSLNLFANYDNTVELSEFGLELAHLLEQLTLNIQSNQAENSNNAHVENSPNILPNVLIITQHFHIDLRINQLHLCSNIETCDILNVINPPEYLVNFDSSFEYVLSILFTDNNSNLYFTILEQFFFSVAENWSFISHELRTYDEGGLCFEFLLSRQLINGDSESTIQRIELDYPDLNYKEYYLFKRTFN